MKKLLFSRILPAALLLAAACTSTAPVVRRPSDPRDRFLIDPRTGYDARVPQSVDQRFQAAWLSVEAGDTDRARQQLTRIQQRQADYLPAELALAAIDVREGRPDLARPIVDAVLNRAPLYTAARVYDAELSARGGDLRRAYSTYAQITAQGPVPEVTREGVIDLRGQLVSAIVASARTAPAAEAVPLLQEALTIDPRSKPTRLLLAQSLVAQRNWNAAFTVVKPLLTTDGDDPGVQATTAEIEAGRGQYEQAIARYQELASRDPRYVPRLNAVKEQWSEANMPPQFTQAIGSEELNRTDLAVLLYWKVASIRFAQNLATPPIAVDVSELPGREEVIRAIAIGMLQVDPVTRRVNPTAPVTAVQLARYAARVLVNRGATCARGAGSDPSRILAACRVTDLSETLPPDAPVTGRAALGVVEQMDRALGGRS